MSLAYRLDLILVAIVRGGAIAALTRDVGREIFQKRWHCILDVAALGLGEDSAEKYPGGIGPELEAVSAPSPSDVVNHTVET